MITIIGHMYILPGREPEAQRALKRLAKAVKADEQGRTLMYLVHLPAGKALSMPPAIPGQVTFVEVYKDRKALDAHLSGKAFTSFVATSKHLFQTVQATASDGSTGTGLFAEFLTVKRIAGFAS